MTRKAISTKERARLFLLHGGRCHICLGRIDGVREAWEVEHVNPLFLSGDDSDENRQPAHVKCHRAKTAVDAGDIAKAKRREEKHIGARKSSRPMPGSKASGWRKPFNGKPERRTP